MKVHYMTLLDCNLKLGNAVVTVVQKTFPLGAVNQVAVFTANELACREVIKILPLYRYLLNKLDKNESEWRQFADVARSLHGGFCGEISNQALAIVKEITKDIEPPIVSELINLDEHVLVVIGRTEGHPEAISTWNSEAVMVDAWSNEVYPASDFRAKQAKEDPLPYYILCDGELKEAPKHYLSGNPSVVYSNTPSGTLEKQRTDYEANMFSFFYEAPLKGIEEREPLITCVGNSSFGV